MTEYRLENNDPAYLATVKNGVINIQAPRRSYSCLVEDAVRLLLCEARVVNELLGSVEEKRQRITDLERVCSRINGDISQTLGKVLGYPWFKDDQEKFPGATEEDGGCVGVYMAEDVAQLAAKRITDLEAALRPFAEFDLGGVSDDCRIGYSDFTYGDCRRAAAVLKRGTT